MQLFDLGDGYTIVCEWKKTRMAFKHEATLMHNGNQIQFKKVCYQNRTWESYTYQTVIRECIGLAFARDRETAERLIDAADKIGKGEAERAFAPFKMMAALGDLLGTTPQEKAGLKKQALSAIPGIDFPNDFDQLSAEEQNKRLDKALKVL